MAARLEKAVPVLPCADIAASARWWVELCGFREVFRHGDPPSYLGIMRDDVWLHLSLLEDAKLARTVGEQTMLRLKVAGVEEFLAAYQAGGGAVHPNGSLHRTPWGSLEFGALDPGGVCVTFFE